MLGTPAYMSPEQARASRWTGGPTSGRSVACSTKCSRAGAPFAGDTISDTLAAILERGRTGRCCQPTRRADSPMLRRCLEKDPRRRLDSAADARLEIDDADRSSGCWTFARAARRPVGVAPVAIAALAGVAQSSPRSRRMDASRLRSLPALPARFAIVPPSVPPLNVSGPIATSRFRQMDVTSFTGSAVRSPSAA